MPTVLPLRLSTSVPFTKSTSSSPPSSYSGKTNNNFSNLSTKSVFRKQNKYGSKPVNGLAIISIEKNWFRKLKFKTIISAFASEKVSKRLSTALQVADLFPTMSPEIVVREARMEDCWGVAETHCSSFFPDYSFPLDFVLRMNRVIGMLAGFSLPRGCKRNCLVAVVTGNLVDNQAFFFKTDDFKTGGFDRLFSLNKGHVAGILTIDTVANFLPRKGPLRQRRTGIAYVSNVAVREQFRRKGIAKRLIIKAEAQAKSWGCRAIALHCDLSNKGAIKLYKDRGFKSVNVPVGAKWPEPRTSPDNQFNIMMKLLN